MTGFFPPSSATTGPRLPSSSKVRWISSPTSREPVNESGDVLVFDHRLTDRPPATRDQVDDAVRNARLREGVVERVRRQRRGARRLHDCGVSGDQRAGCHSDGDRERKIERGHNAEDAVRLEVADAALARCWLMCVGGVSLVPFQFTAVVPEEVDRLVDLRNRLVPCFCIFVGHQRCDLEFAVLDDVRGVAKYRDALLPGRLLPLVEGVARGRDGLVDVRLILPLRTPRGPGPCLPDS